MQYTLNWCTMDDPKLKGQVLLPGNENMFTENYILNNISVLFM